MLEAFCHCFSWHHGSKLFNFLAAGIILVEDNQHIFFYHEFYAAQKMSQVSFLYRKRYSHSHHSCYFHLDVVSGQYG